MDQESEYLRILRLYAQCIESLKGTEAPDNRLFSAQDLANKMLDHALSLYALADGVDIGPMLGWDGSLVAVASASSLARAAVEAYLRFYYLFIEPENDDESEFRYCVWRLAGLCIRETVASEFPPQTPKEKAFRLNQQEEIRKLRERLKKTERYIGHSPGTQLKALGHKRWRFPLSIDLAKQAGIGQSYFRTVYTILSDYDHSGALAVQQMGAIWSVEHRLDAVESTLSVVKAFLSKMLIVFVDIFPDAASVLETDPATTRIVQIYSGALGMIE